MKLNRFTLLFLLALCMGILNMTDTAFATTAKQHWAVPSLEAMQDQNLFLNVKKDAKSLDAPIKMADFLSLLKETWTSQTTVPLAKDTSANVQTTLTRKEAAQKIYEAVSPYLNKKNDEPLVWIQSVGIMNGYPGGDFKSANKVTLAQGIIIMKNLKEYMKDQPNFRLEPKVPSVDLTPSKNTLAYSIKANEAGTVDFTLSWGEKNTGGYSVTITSTQLVGSELKVYYRLTSPKPGSMVTQAFTYPKAVKTLDLTPEAAKNLTITLYEE